MNNQNHNPENVVSKQPFFETIFTKHKKLLYAVPIVFVSLLLALYFTKKPTDDSAAKQEENIDVTLPGSKTKELSNNKLEVMSDFSELSEEKQKEQNKSEKINLDEMNETASLPTDQKYQDENDKKVVDKVNKMLSEMDKQKKKSSAAYSAPVQRNNQNDVKEINYEEKANTEANFNSFFNTKSNVGNNKPDKAIQQTDPLIYASIKGDHLRLRNNSRVTLILPKETTIDGKIYKKNTLVYAMATFTGNRVNLTINNINQVPIRINAYDAEDGNLGLQVQRSLMAETSSEVARDGADEVDVNGVPLGNTIKSLFKRKQQEPKIDLLNNQRLILKIVQ